MPSRSGWLGRPVGFKLAPDAAGAGIHRTNLSGIERGTRNVSPIHIERLVSALSPKLSELFQDVER